MKTKRILALAPHPDDESIGCGGALLAHLAQRAEVEVVFLTSGEKGGHGRSESETIRVREQEARAAAEILRVRGIEFWRLPDGALRPTHAAVERLRRKINRFKPDIIYVTHDREMHPDHRAAVRLLRRALAVTKIKPDVLGYEVWTPIQKLSEIVDISPFMERKLRAVRAHRSQCAVVGGEMHSWPGGDYAEVFTRLKL
jgi:LmbE family N-acetylglucosaminyl deacetylase